MKINWHDRWKWGDQEFSPFEIATFVLTCAVVLGICALAIWGDG